MITLLGPVVKYPDLGVVHVFASTYKSSLAAVRAVHTGAVPARALRNFFRVGFDNAKDEAVSLKACGGSHLPCASDEAMCEVVVQQGQLGLLKWMCAQKPPYPCDFEACLEVAEEGGAAEVYIQMGRPPGDVQS
jgi:hypothetical protein